MAQKLDSHETIGLTIPALLLILTAAAFWGGTAVAVKFASEALPSVSIAAIRFALASMFLIVLMQIRRESLRIDRDEFKLSVVLGAMLFVQIVLFNLAIKISNSSHSILLISSFVFWVLLIEHFVTKGDRICFRTFWGMVLAGCGVSMTFFIAKQSSDETLTHNNDYPSLWGNALMLLSALILSIKVVYTKYAVRQMDPMKLILWQHMLGTITFAVFSLTTEDLQKVTLNSIDLPVILGLLYQGILVGGICFVIQASLLQHYSATQISVFAFATPLFGIIAAKLLRSDSLSPIFVAAAVCVAAGIYLVNCRKKRNDNHGATNQ